ncbi:MAG TPA: hypothetical protein VK968_15840, partial [Roseimicrobium sp.]|nr:hypothetical protein [Roseimicrobium sp.]
NNLLAHTYLHGFARYPQAIMDFIDVPSPTAWYDQHRYGLTFYNRSPEFNTFGKSRFFTTYVPLSLEAGPSYQHPFIYDSSGSFNGGTSEILNLNSLFGTFGFTSNVTDDDGSTVKGGNVVNRMQVDMLLGYLRRTWPGYSGTFITKYGEAECWQIALNATLMARMATTMLSDNVSEFSRDWSFRSTSVDYAPDSDMQPGCAPERFYWSIDVTENAKKVTKLMLPQMPGPHIIQVRLFARVIPASREPATSIPGPLNAPPKNKKAQLKDFTTPVYVQYRYEIEYFMEPFGPVLDLTEFPTRVDFLDITANGGGQSRHQQFGATNAVGEPLRASRNWSAKANLRRLSLFPAFNTLIGPGGAKYNGTTVPNRRVLQSPVFTIGQREIVDEGGVEKKQAIVPIITDSDYTDWDPQPFEAAVGGSVTVNFKFRPGMGIYGTRLKKGVVDPENDTMNNRPRQMIPLGTKPEDSLQATLALKLEEPNIEQAVTWHIDDPRLSGNLAQWKATQTPESASERSKFRYIQRAPTGVTVDGNALDRGDEYTTSGRVASPGYWSLLHTGIQAGVPWRTLNFGPGDAQNSPPDWVLLDLIGATYPMTHDQWKLDSTLPDAFSTPSYMNSTAGQVNLNSRIYPQTAFFNPPERTEPLAAVFKNLRSDSDVAALVENIGAYQTDTDVFKYVGELANVPGCAGTGASQWEKESLLRNMSGCLTTKSNTFGVWGVAQVVKKLPKNAQHDAFERGDTVRAEKRFYALVERYV